jgi:YidC/Oxa1 family membrane protein insertase
MSFLYVFFNEILIRPFLNILVLFYHLTGDVGVGIILLTILVRLVLYPFSGKAIRSQQELSKLQPQIQEIQKRYKNNQQEQAQELMRLYKEHGVNPFAGCLPLLIQLPVFIALFEVFRRGLDPAQLQHLYYFIPKPTSISYFFLHVIDLKNTNIFLAFSVGLLQLIQSKLSLPPKTAAGGQSGMKRDFASSMNQQMIYILPIVLFVASVGLPAGVVLYIGASTLFGIIQQVLITKAKNKTPQGSAT